MLGIGPQELLLIGLLVLVIFGPGKGASMARDLGRFVSGAQNTVDDFKSELLDSEEVKEVRRSVEELKDETHHPVEKLKNEAASSIEGEEQDSEPPSEAETHELTEGREPPPEVRISPATTRTQAKSSNSSRTIA